MKVMAIGAMAATAPPEAARRARKPHVVPPGARSRRLAIQPNQPVAAPAMNAHRAGWSADTPFSGIWCAVAQRRAARAARRAALRMRSVPVPIRARSWEANPMDTMIPPGNGSR